VFGKSAPGRAPNRTLYLVAGLTPTLRVRPVEAVDLGPVGLFLHRQLNSRLDAGTWSQAARPSWEGDQPNHGFLLERDDEVLGVNLAFYSTRRVAGVERRFCNLAALVVVPEHRAQAVRLVRGLLRQPGFSFTDLSPSGQVVDIDRRLGFRPLDTTTAITANLSVRGSRAAEVLTRVDEIADRLEDAEQRRLFQDHRSALAARHLLVVDGDRQCYVLYRRDRRKRLPLFATLLHVSDPDLYLEARPLVDRHLRSEGALLTLVELRVLGGRTPPGARLFEGRPKMLKSQELLPDEVDDLYSELTSVPW
jgi:hypothetical protein